MPDFVRALRAHVGTSELWLSGVTAVVLRGEEVLLVRRADSGAWTPVTGILDPGEEPAVGAQREVLEETTVTCRVESLVAVGAHGPVSYPNGDRARYLDLAFRCTWVEGEAAVGDDESCDVGWFRLDDMPDLHPFHAERVRLAVAGDPVPEFVRPDPR